ncbi:MAG: hypothetical protein A2147_08030 [Chloroflexi bacterium RBG_16_57_8]|nr:MAG: hypothetical protein A2147_08030 [Chloroflexi bacterium RBG_16_57_8]
MITDLDETIKQLLIKKGGLDTSEVDIAFDVPDREWSASVSKPTVNLYLYDIRENLTLRKIEWTVQTNGNSTTRRKNASRIDLSYLVTVWANNIEDQHRLLWHVMATLFRYPILPQEMLTGGLAGQDYPILASTAQPDGLFSNPSDFWAALDNEIKPSVNYVVTVPLDLAIAFTSPVTRTATLGVKPPDGEAEHLIQISGLVHAAGDRTKVVPGATIVAKEANMTAETNTEGKYAFSRIPAGKHTFQVRLPDKKTKDFAVSVPGPNYDLEV